MAEIKIIEVESRSLLKQFIQYPNHLYRDDPNYVTPLLSERLEFFDFDKNPFYRQARVQLYLAMANGEVIGRIASCINFAHNDYHEDKVGFFGFFDCGDDYEVGSKLLKVAMINLKREGMEWMRGPTNFSTNHECGFLIEGFDGPPVIMMTYNQPYLPKLAEKFGFKKAMDLVAFDLTRETGIPERIQNTVEKMAKRTGITIRNIRMNDFENEVNLINDLYNQAWEKNWGFVPMNSEEFGHAAKGLKQIVDPDLVFIAEHEGNPVAFLLGIPDVNQALIKLNGRLLPFGLMKLLWHTKVRNKIEGIRVVTMGVIPQYQKRGIDSMLYVAVFKGGSNKGYRRAELSWVLETNDLMCSAAEKMGAKAYRRYRIVEMPL